METILTPAPVQHSTSTRDFARPTGLPWMIFLGVLWPLASLAVELSFGVSAEIFLDPIPTSWHVALIAWVPAGNAALIYYLCQGRVIPASLFLLQALSIGVSGVYLLQFLPWIPLGVLFCWTGFGLLPLGPLVAFFSTLIIRRKCYQANRVNDSRYHGVVGALTGVALLLVLEIPTLTAAFGLTLAANGSAAQKQRGLAILEHVASDPELLGFGSGSNSARFAQELEFVSALTGLRKPQPSDVLREVYRATGTPMEIVRHVRRGWDLDRGGTQVGTLLPELSLQTSRAEAVIHPEDSLSYTEWTMVFRNNYGIQQEARTEIALPPGGVISRVTLWVDGEEREAAFAGKSAVREAYERVVARQRDPLLVTQTAPGRALLQCFPVPPRGEMKIRVGITAPLHREDDERARYVFPRMVTHNFRVDDKTMATVRNGDYFYHQCEITTHSFAFKAPHAESVRWLYDKRGQQYIVQTTHRVEAAPTPTIIAIDGSASLGRYARTINETLSRLPKARVVLATRFEPREINASDIRPDDFAGGADNILALQRAVRLARETGSTAILWIHGPQPTILTPDHPLRDAGGLRVISLQLEAGRNIIFEQLGDALNLETIPLLARVPETLRLTVRQLAGIEPAWRTDYTTSASRPADLPTRESSTHLARLWAADRIHQLTREGATGEAVGLAQRYQLVTAVSGAVVLENASQYKEAGLNPVTSDTVPMVPEPGLVSLFLLGAVSMIFISRRRKAGRFQVSRN